MEIPTWGREVAHWTVSGVDDTQALEVSYDQVTWFPLARVTTGATVLVAGPDAQNNPAGTWVLPAGHNDLWVRTATLTANSEDVGRYAGFIDVGPISVG